MIIIGPKDKPKAPRKQPTPKSTRGPPWKQNATTKAKHHNTPAQAADAQRLLDAVLDGQQQLNDEEEEAAAGE